MENAGDVATSEEAITSTAHQGENHDNDDMEKPVQESSPTDNKDCAADPEGMSVREKPVNDSGDTEETNVSQPPAVAVPQSALVVNSTQEKDELHPGDSVSDETDKPEASKTMLNETTKMESVEGMDAVADADEPMESIENHKEQETVVGTDACEITSNESTSPSEVKETDTAKETELFEETVAKEQDDVVVETASSNEGSSTKDAAAWSSTPCSSPMQESKKESPNITPPAARLPVSSPAYTRSKRKREIAAATRETDKRTKVIVICEDVETQILETTTPVKELVRDSREMEPKNGLKAEKEDASASNDDDDPPSIIRRTNAPPDPFAEIYVELANRMMFTFDSDTQQILQALELPGGGISGLGLLKTNLRRPTVLERWSPWEIGMFQAGVAHYGKKFDLVQKEVSTKSVQEVIDFYLIWKKTSHYKAWKQQYVPPHLDVDSEDEAAITGAAAK